MHHNAAALPRRKLLIDLIAMLSIGLVAVLGYKLSPLLAPRADLRLTPPAGCNLHRGSCRVAVGQGTLELSIAPHPIPLLKPLQIEVHTRDLEVRRIDADFAGIGMGMGYNRPQLLPVGAPGDGLYRAETSLPVCITGSMNWELTLMVDTPAEYLLIPIRFSIPEPGTES